MPKCALEMFVFHHIRNATKRILCLLSIQYDHPEKICKCVLIPLPNDYTICVAILNSIRGKYMGQMEIIITIYITSSRI